MNTPKYHISLILLFSVLIFLSACQTTPSPDTNIYNPDIDFETTASTPDKADLGNRVWLDTNGDGIKQTPENGFRGITVNLWTDRNNDGTPEDRIASQVTDAGGFYRFNAIDPSINYILQVEAPNGFVFSPKNNPNTSGNDRDSDISSNGLSDSINVEAGRYNYYVDAAFKADGGTPPAPIKLSRLGNRVWQDLNGDGIKQSNEPGFKGIKVNLWISTRNNGVPNSLIKTTSTDSNGYYFFNALDSSIKYYLQVEIPEDYIASPQNKAGISKDKDSDLKANGFTLPLSLAPLIYTYWIDIGLTKITSATTSTLNGSVWLDENQDGIKQTSEKGLENVFVALYTESRSSGININSAESTQLTNSQGKFNFTDLNPDGIYYLEVKPWSGYELSPKAILGGQDSDQDSDVSETIISDQRISITEQVVLQAGETISSYSAGLIKTLPYKEIAFRTSQEIDDSYSFNNSRQYKSFLNQGFLFIYSHNSSTNETSNFEIFEQSGDQWQKLGPLQLNGLAPECKNNFVQSLYLEQASFSGNKLAIPCNNELQFFEGSGVIWQKESSLSLDGIDITNISLYKDFLVINTVSGGFETYSASAKLYTFNGTAWELSETNLDGVGNLSEPLNLNSEASLLLKNYQYDENRFPSEFIASLGVYQVENGNLISQGNFSLGQDFRDYEAVLDDSTLVIYDKPDNLFFSYNGNLTIYDYENNTWNTPQQLNIISGGIYKLQVANDKLLILFQRDSNDNPVYSAVQLFQKTTNRWELEQTFRAERRGNYHPDGIMFRLGSIALDNNTFTIGELNRVGIAHSYRLE